MAASGRLHCSQPPRITNETLSEKAVLSPSLRISNESPHKYDGGRIVVSSACSSLASFLIDFLGFSSTRMTNSSVHTNSYSRHCRFLYEGDAKSNLVDFRSLLTLKTKDTTISRMQQSLNRSFFQPVR